MRIGQSIRVNVYFKIALFLYSIDYQSQFGGKVQDNSRTWYLNQNILIGGAIALQPGRTSSYPNTQLSRNPIHTHKVIVWVDLGNHGSTIHVILSGLTWACNPLYM